MKISPSMRSALVSGGRANRSALVFRALVVNMRACYGMEGASGKAKPDLTSGPAEVANRHWIASLGMGSSTRDLRALVIP